MIYMERKEQPTDKKQNIALGQKKKNNYVRTRQMRVRKILLLDNGQ